MSQNASSNSAGRALIVDDSDLLRRALSRQLEALGYEVVAVATPSLAFPLVASSVFDVVLADVHMEEGGGLALLGTLSQSAPDVPVILMTGDPTVDTAARAVEYKAFRYLSKPLARDELARAMTAAVEEARSRRAQPQGNANEIRHEAEKLDRAIDQLWMAYQPIYRADSLDLEACEALMRSREKGMESPLAILDAADRTSKLDQVGRAVRELAPQPVVADDTSVMLFVNLHARDLSCDDLIDTSTPLGRLSRRVVLEITERAALDDLRAAKERVDVLRTLGFRVAIDDLGAGYSGLTSIAELAPEFVKIDMSLIRHLDKLTTKQRLVRAIADACHDMGSIVIAEGIETVDEMLAARDLGVDLLQGFLLGRPGPSFAPPRRAPLEVESAPPPKPTG